MYNIACGWLEVFVEFSSCCLLFVPNHKKRMIKQLSPKAIFDGFLAKVEGAASNFCILVHSNHDG